MKKIVALLVISGLLLAGCQSQKFKDYKAQGEQQLADKKYDEAIKSFSLANSESPGNADIIDLLTQAYEEEYTYYSEQGSKALDDKNFSKAATYLEKAAETGKALEKDKDEISSLKEQAKEAKNLNTAQKNLNAYAKWYNGVLKDGYSMTQEWKSLLNQASTGQATREDLKGKLSTLLPKMDKLNNEVSSFGLNRLVPDGTHKKLSGKTENLVKNAQKTLTLLSTSEEVDGEEVTLLDIIDEGNKIAAYKSDLDDYSITLQSYADDKGLKLEFKADLSSSK